MFLSISLIIFLHSKINRICDFPDFHVTLYLIGFFFLIFSLMEAITIEFATRIYGGREVMYKDVMLTLILNSIFRAYLTLKGDFRKKTSAVLLLLSLMVFIGLCVMNIFFESNRLKIAMVGGGIIFNNFLGLYETGKMSSLFSISLFLFLIVMYTSLINQ